MSSTYLMNALLGVDGLFFALGFVQVIAFFFFLIAMKETQGLSAQEKKKLYVSDSAAQAASKNDRSFEVDGGERSFEKRPMSINAQLVVSAPLLTEGV